MASLRRALSPARGRLIDSRVVVFQGDRPSPDEACRVPAIARPAPLIRVWPEYRVRGGADAKFSSVRASVVERSPARKPFGPAEVYLKRTVYRVRPDRGAWIVHRDGSERILGRYRDRQRAVEFGRQLCRRKAPSQLVVHDERGVVLYDLEFGAVQLPAG